MLKNKFISFIILGTITYSASFVGAISTISYKEPWYSNLNKARLIHQIGFLLQYGQHFIYS